MKFKAILFAATAAVAATFAGAASAEDLTPNVSFNAGVSNDYVFRGVSQTNGDMQAILRNGFRLGPHVRRGLGLERRFRRLDRR